MQDLCMSYWTRMYYSIVKSTLIRASVAVQGPLVFVYFCKSTKNIKQSHI